MKALLVAGLVGVIIGGITYFSQLPKGPIEYIAPQVVTETVEVTPDWAQDADAVKAAQDVIRKKELEAELQNLAGERDALSARIAEIEKELGTF